MLNCWEHTALADITNRTLLLLIRYAELLVFPIHCFITSQQKDNPIKPVHKQTLGALATFMAGGMGYDLNPGLQHKQGFPQVFEL